MASGSDQVGGMIMASLWGQIRGDGVHLNSVGQL